MNWTGLGIAFPRDQWPHIRQRNELNKTGVYILVGYQTEDDLPTLYIGQGDGVRNRIEAHFANKEFWDWGIVFGPIAFGNALMGAMQGPRYTALKKLRTAKTIADLWSKSA
jgi:hypothetical protein